jgi:dUTP pyrophosphatase
VDGLSANKQYKINEVLNMEVNINYTKLRCNAVEPTRGSLCAAGYDLSAAIDESVMIPPHCTVKIGTGLSVELPDGTFGGIYARSGIATKEGLRPANCTGVIDSDYRGEIVVALHNDSDVHRIVEPGERIAQLIVQPYIQAIYKEINALSDTERGTGGFGSTGK